MSIKPNLRSKFKKSISMFVLVTMLNQTLLPSVSMALTSGPTAPEATSFEPIDTTDMVNPLTGDFTYNMPLMEVPGPEGSYPVSLSYHAGIQPNEDASWMGLGWSLNTGAINRNVNGYPDDWQNVQNVVRDYWSGGETKTVGVNVGFGMAGASVSIGLQFSQDTYRGFGVGASVNAGYGIDLGAGGGLGIGLTVGISPYGDSYAGANIDASFGTSVMRNLGTSANLGLSTNFKSISASANISASYGGGAASFGTNGVRLSYGSLGISISSAGNFSASLGSISVGFSSVSNANAGRIQTESDGWGIGIPLGPVSLGVSYSTVRYWSDETAYTSVNGFLYSRGALTDVGAMDNSADDNYYLLDAKNNNIVTSPEAERQLGGAFPNTDDYSVSAQGLGGTIKPYQYQGVLFTQNKINTQDRSKEVYQNVKSSAVTINTKKEFRFINDFSNAYRQSNTSFSNSTYSFSAKTNNGVDQSAGYENTTGWDATANRLEGSRHIEYFKNDEIYGGTALTKGLIDCKAAGFERRTDNQIGAFMITNASGVTYHYALPAYSYNEISFTQKRSTNPADRKFNRLSRSNPYAYTWYLTAITGPDYVDRGNAGISDDDWGYWVRFDYGKMVDQYNWRNPSEGFNRDIDNQFEMFSSGSKEIYYLNAIRTRTHTAIFEKELRADGKGYNADVYTNQPTYQMASKTITAPGGGPAVTEYIYPNPTMRLKSILLLRNDQMTETIEQLAQKAGQSGYNGHYTFVAQHLNSNGNYDGGPMITDNVVAFHEQNIIDKYDIAASDLVAKCIRRIQFNHDYSLCTGTTNSSDPNGTKYVQASNTTPMPLLGKLTLNSIDFQGQGGQSLQPLTEFKYDLDPDDPANQVKFSISAINSVNKRATAVLTSVVAAVPGDIIKFTANGATFCFTIIKVNGLSADVQFFDTVPSSAISGVKGWFTKNPPYNKDAFDRWGCYKSDYVPNDNENTARQTTEASSRQTDVWSLRKIISPLGNEINVKYESDTYNRSVLNNNRTLIVNTITPSTTLKYNLYIDDLSTVNKYEMGDKVDVLVLKKQYRSFSGTDIVKWDAITLKDALVTGTYGSYIEVQASLADDNKLNEITSMSGSTVSFPTANVSQARRSLYYGGGIRVKSISVDDLAGNVKQTNYDYGLPGFGAANPSSSGVTSYEPATFDADNVQQFGADAVKLFRTELYRRFSNILSIAREAPAPGVFYEYINVTDQQEMPDGSLSVPEGRVQYQYETFKENMLGITETVNSTAAGSDVSLTYNGQTKWAQIQNRINRNFELKDYTTRVGILKRITNYDKLGNKLTETINNYLYDDLEDKKFSDQSVAYESRLGAYNGINYNYQGVIQERFGNSRIVATDVPAGNNLLKGNEIFLMNSKETYPAIKTGTTQIDYKNGNTIQEKVMAYDYYSGLITKTLTFDTYGNRTINEVVPAYRIPAFIKMGLKTVAATPANQNKQMLTQEATNYTYAADINNTPIGIISASAKSWSNGIDVIDPDGIITTSGQAGIWRQSASYNWMPLGIAAGNITPIGSFTGYFATGGSSNPSWNKTTQITKYNVYSTALESYDLSQQYAATKMGYANSKVLMTALPAKYAEMAFSGAEDGVLSSGVFSAGVSKGTGVIVTDTLKAHTGINSIKVAAGQAGFSYNVPLSDLNTANKGYIVSVWAKPESESIPTGANLYYQIGSGAVVTPVQSYAKTAAGWYLLEINVPRSFGAGNLVVGCKNSSAGNIYFDDFRFQPAAAAAMSYVYDSKTGDVNYILGLGNTYTRYQYDALGRLIRTFKEVLGKPNKRLVSSVNYNYGKMVKPNWQNTGNITCHLDAVTGNGNGLVDSLQKDINPRSATYNTTRWKATNAYSSTCPRTMYAKLETTAGGAVTGPGGYYYNDYVIKFYQDPERTLATTLTASTTFNLRISQNITDAGGNPQTLVQNYTFSGSSGSSSVTIGRIILSKCQTTSTNPFVGGGFSSTSPTGSSPYCMSNYTTLQPGTGYFN